MSYKDSIIKETRQFGKTNILVFEDREGNCSEEQIKELGYKVFPCGKCSNEDFSVYHNVIGQHRHETNYELWEEKIEVV